MKILISESEFSLAKSNDKIPLECKKCGGTFFVTKKEILLGRKRSEQSYIYCSIKCRTEDTTKSQKFNCPTCGKEFVRISSEIRKNTSGKFFCSKKCAAIINNSLKPKRQKQPKVLKEKEEKINKSNDKNKKIKKLKAEHKTRERKMVCTKCGTPLTSENCYKQKRPNGNYVLYPTCKNCHSKIVMDRWIALKEKIIKDMGGKCVDCGISHPYELYDFHHLDPSQKEYNWKKIKGFSEEKRNAELSKCVLLCANCHAQRHADECPNSQTNTSEINFKNTLIDICGNHCFDCGKTFTRQLYSFHHVNPSDKTKEVLSLKHEDALTELKKCVMLCHNCHRLRHKEIDKK